MSYKPGDAVLCEREAPMTLSWKKYDGRTGTVIEVSKKGGRLEIGVAFTPEAQEPECWFLPNELRAVPEVAA